MNQEDLLRNAVYEEQLNRISLEKMIFIEESKKRMRNASFLKYKNEQKHVKFYDSKMFKHSWPKIYFRSDQIKAADALKIAYDPEFC